MPVITFDRTWRRLNHELNDGLFTRGVQISVAVDGAQVLDAAVGDNGLGQPMSGQHVFRVYCTIKPIAALAVARLVDQGLIDLDEPLEPHLPGMTGLANGVTLRHILTHTAGLHRPMGVEMEMVPSEQRRHVIARSRRPPSWRVGIDAAYSEYVGWHMLGWLIEGLTGQELREHLREHVLDPLGMQSTWIGMTADQYHVVLPAVGVNTDLRQLGGYPMLFERTQRVCTETNAAHGGYTNARDLTQLYRALLAQLNGREIDALPSAATLREFCTPARPTVYDEVLARECAYGLGFMTPLEQHAFSNHCSESAFGHSGNIGASFAFADPHHNLAVGVVYNGLVGYETAFLRRRALIDAIYADLHGDTEAADSQEIVSPPKRRFRVRGVRRESEISCDAE